MAARYVLNPRQSRFTVQAFKAGLLSFLGHNPTFAVRDFSGAISFEGGEVKGMSVQLSVNADALDLIDNVSASDRNEIMNRVRGEVLETQSNPTIRYESAEVSAEATGPGRYRVRVAGRLTLRGVTRPQEVGGELSVYTDGVRLVGQSGLLMSGYGIKPVTALGGAIRLQDELTLSYDIVGFPEEGS